jgi:hypothetical protein
MRTYRLLCAILLAAGIAAGAPSVRAQSDPRQILAGMIYQVSTGTPNPNWYGQQLWQTIALQTGNTGVYLQLRQLGTVSNVVVTQSAALPGGVLYAMTAQHAFGISYWVMGIGSLTNRIEYASFAAGPGSSPYMLPGASGTTTGNGSPQPSTAPSIGADPPEQPAPKPKPTPSQSEACKKFPNLC